MKSINHKYTRSTYLYITSMLNHEISGSQVHWITRSVNHISMDHVSDILYIYWSQITNHQTWCSINHKVQFHLFVWSTLHFSLDPNFNSSEACCTPDRIFIVPQSRNFVVHIMCCSTVHKHIFRIISCSALQECISSLLPLFSSHFFMLLTDHKSQSTSS